MNSIEAAQAYLDDEWNKQNTLDYDALQRAALRRMMGFDYMVTIKNGRAILIDKEKLLKTTCSFPKEDEASIKRLVRACLKLKRMHDAN